MFIQTEITISTALNRNTYLLWDYTITGHPVIKLGSSSIYNFLDLGVHTDKFDYICSPVETGQEYILFLLPKAKIFLKSTGFNCR